MSRYDRIPSKRLTSDLDRRAKCLACTLDTCPRKTYWMGHGEDKGEGPLPTDVSQNATQEALDDFTEVS